MITLLQGTGGAEGGSLMQSLIMFGLIGLVFYLFMIWKVNK